MAFVKVAETKDLKSGEGIAVEVGGAEVAVFQVDGTVYAIGAVCPHRDGPLAEGHLDGTTLTCPYHFARFDLKTGAVLEGPAEEGVKCYAARVSGSNVEIDVP